MKTPRSLAFLVAASATLALPPVASGQSLLTAREGHKTEIKVKKREERRLEKPNSRFFRLVRYPTKLGPMQAYLGRPPSTGKHAAILWVTGGFPPGGAGRHAWEPVPSRNDQSARAYRRAGLIMMYPSFRGTAGNPGYQESFYGEVDDLIAAAEYLAKLDEVDPERIFLGGHSTGGTLALLAATTGHPFRAVISFGPVHAASVYGKKCLPTELLRGQEARLRAPVNFLKAIRCPTFVIEGSKGNTTSLDSIASRSKNPDVKVFKIRGAGHFDVLAPVNALIATKISQLKGGAKLELSDDEVQDVYQYYDFEAGKRNEPDFKPEKPAPAVKPKPAKRPKRKDAGAANGPGWHIKLDEALGVARRTKRPVLALFTCSDRGAASEALHEIMATKEFGEWADESLVLLELDFPVRKRQSPKLKLQNVRLKGDCDVRKLPEVVFLDGDGQVLGRLPRAKKGAKGGAKGGAKAWLEAAKAALAKIR